MSHKERKVHEVHSKTFSNNKTGIRRTHMHVLEEKGEPKRYRNEVLPLTSLKPFLNWANVSSRT